MVTNTYIARARAREDQTLAGAWAGGTEYGVNFVLLNKTSREGLRQVYDGRSSIQIYEKTLSQRKNDKWE